MRIHRIPTTSEPHLVFVKDRPRNSGLTSLRFVSLDRLVCCDYNEKKMHLVQVGPDDLEVIATIPTSVRGGASVQTDLLDWNGDDLLVTSNFYQGTQSFYAVRGDTVSFIDEAQLTDFGRCHGVRFVPGYDDLLFIAYHQGIVIADYRKKKILHVLQMSEMVQDAAFIGDYVLVPARTDHIRIDGPFGGEMYATVYLLRMPQSLYSSPPQLIDTWRGIGHLDAIKEHGVLAYSANQYTDTVDVFGISAAERIEARGSIPGFAMPHGVDIRPDGLLGVTNYLDNSVRLVELPFELPRGKRTIGAE